MDCKNVNLKPGLPRLPNPPRNTSRCPLARCILRGSTAYSEPDVSFYNWDGKPGQSMEPREEIAHIPKSNRMPDAPHSVKVETQVVDGVQDLRQYFIGCIKMP